MDLVIMAAGMGSRFGGLKQVEPINENGEFIIDYSIYDAIKAGFDRVLFIIKEENYQLFRQTVGARIEQKIKVEYVFQDMQNIPQGTFVPENRVKPLGTGHAIYCIQDKVSDKFGIINADDFYGRDAFKVLYEFLANNKEQTEFACINYHVKDTLTNNGATKRGVCVTNDGIISQIIESSIEEVDGQIYATPLTGGDKILLDKDAPVSMNMFALNKHLFPYLNKRFETFLKENQKDIEKCEYLMPTILDEMMSQGLITMKSISTTAIWQGVTYKEDKEKLVNFLKEQTRQGVYPAKLWK